MRFPPCVLFAAFLAACEDDAPAAATPLEEIPPVSVMEIPVSHRNADSAPAAAVQMSIAPDAIRVNGEIAQALESGRVPAGAGDGPTILSLQSALENHRNAPAVALRVHLDISYLTLARVMATIDAAGIHTAFFEVRSGAGPETGFLAAMRFRVGASTGAPVPFEGAAQRNWDEFAAVWEDVYSGCRREDYVDCEPRADHVATEGQLEMRAWARDTAVRIEFDRFGAPEPETSANTGPELLPGVPRPPAPEEESPPDTHATFTWRFRAAVAELSAITDAIRPLCGTRACSLVVTGDPGVPAMRLISLIGAAFPNGTPEPTLYFEVPVP